MGSPYIPMTGRRLNADGTVDIRCRYCGKAITRRLYDRFSTATCAVCYKEELAGKTPEEIIYAAQQAELKQYTEVVDDMPASGFRAIGLRKRLAEVVDVIKQRLGRKRRDILKD